MRGNGVNVRAPLELLVATCWLGLTGSRFTDEIFLGGRFPRKDGSKARAIAMQSAL